MLVPDENNRIKPTEGRTSARRCEFAAETADKYSREYCIAPGYVVREIAGEYVAIPVAVNPDVPPQTVLLNETGYFMWSLLQEKTSYKNLINRMTEEFEVSADEAEKDTDEFLSCLDKYNLLEIRTEETK